MDTPVIDGDLFCRLFLHFDVVYTEKQHQLECNKPNRNVG